MIFHCSFDLHFFNVGYLFMYLLAICESSLEKYLFRPLPIFFIGLLIFLLLSCMSCLYILEVNALLVAYFVNIFSLSVDSLFVSFMVSFAMQKLLHLIRFHLFVFVFIFITLGGGLKKISL